MNDRLRQLWDFADLPGSQGRLSAALADELTPGGRAEVLTQLARLDGLAGRFEEGEERLREAARLAGGIPVVDIRIRLERGRLIRSGGDPAASLPHFEVAHQLALAAGLDCLAADAAHMAALVAGSRFGFVEWTERGLALALEETPGCRYWAGPLLNNLGWELMDSDEHELALDAFRRALAERLAGPARESEIDQAREAVAAALRSLGRTAEAGAVMDGGRAPGAGPSASPS